MIRRILAVAQITLLETLWKKHVYVLLLVLLGIYFWFGRLNFFELGKEASFLKLVAMTSIGIFSLIVTIFAAARQIPNEIERRTLYPLLAKPVTRLQFMTGKFLGVYVMVIAVIVLPAALFAFLLSRQGIKIGPVYWQAVVLLVLQMGVFTSIVLALSTFLSHAATVVLSFLVYYLLGQSGATLEDLLHSESLPSSMTWFYQGVLWAMPRLDLFNISGAVVHSNDPQPWSIVAPFILYATCCIAVILLLGSAVFSRKDI